MVTIRQLVERLFLKYFHPFFFDKRGLAVIIIKSCSTTATMRRDEPTYDLSTYVNFKDLEGRDLRALHVPYTASASQRLHIPQRRLRTKKNPRISRTRYHDTRFASSFEPGTAAVKMEGCPGEGRGQGTDEMGIRLCESRRALRGELESSFRAPELPPR